ncbi:MAG: LysR family transcriptional regulator [Novosphingobium sp.]|nr:LysR family transcriptional regulator [Novosphingobium sp.]
MADLTVFLVVAQEGSFTRAAARLGMSQPALSQIIRRLEGKIGLRLLRRTTRSVSPTEAGGRLLDTLTPALASLDAALMELTTLRDTPSGTIRITAVEHAAEAFVYPVLRALLPAYPDITVEIALDYGLADLAAEGFDAGVRLGEQVDKDMIAVRISPDMRQAVVGAPGYFENHATPVVPQDLIDHACINLWLSSARGNYVWEFGKDERDIKIRVGGPLAFNDIAMMRTAAVDGFGLVNLPECYVEPYLADGRLIRVLDDWCQPQVGYHLYYPSRRQPTPAFSLVLNALRHRA